MLIVTESQSAAIVYDTSYFSRLRFARGGSATLYAEGGEGHNLDSEEAAQFVEQYLEALGPKQREILARVRGIELKTEKAKTKPVAEAASA